MTVLHQVRRIAVIGAGPSGLSAVKYEAVLMVFDIPLTPLQVSPCGEALRQG